MADIYNIHINTLQIIENELGRLHHNMRAGAGDDDVTQEQITNLHAELTRLSEALSEAEIECTTSGNQSETKTN